jgi:hypothetical protein
MTDTTYDESQALGARTQSLYRDVNERVLEINEAFSVAVPLGDWVCECADHSCVERIPLTMEEYEAVRANAMRFAIAPSAPHFFPELENVVTKTERYWVVEKTGTAGELAAKVDPRKFGVRGKSSDR